MKNVINSFSHDLWLSNLTEGWLMIKSHMSNNKVTYPSDQAVTWGHGTNKLHYIFILRSLLPLKLSGWWHGKLKYFFISKAPLFFHQFHQFSETCLCRPICFKNLSSQSGKKFLISTMVKFPIRLIYKVSQTENKKQNFMHP